MVSLKTGVIIVGAAVPKTGEQVDNNNPPVFGSHLKLLPFWGQFTFTLDYKEYFELAITLPYIKIKHCRTVCMSNFISNVLNMPYSV